ncbi:ABC transporter substrate-binding protein [Streptomyces beigongshangae]|uniref:ABC transporter substrate-binding protein n=1 Tax=Streptomyces beigongshangae TaxID=2841597 RepID=UPI0021A8CBFB|nr:ABC transporter substrate-binding protein [Streptomyces sp. REN17]
MRPRRRPLRRRPREWGPVEWTAALGFGVLLVVAVTVVVGAARGPGKCGDDLREVNGDCVGVTEYSFEADPGIASLVEAVAEENARVKRGWEDPPSGPEIPYVRIALMMPFTSDEHSAMTTDMIRRGLAGALVAQRQANRFGGPRFQLLLAPDGRNLDAWEPVVTRLAELAEDTEAPLVGVSGIPSSTPETREAIAALSARKIPTVGPVITASTMNSPYFFKTSPNNDEFTRALKLYLDDRPARQKGFLVWDNRKQDVYSQNLRSVFMKHFDGRYDLAAHSSNFVGSSGTGQGVPQRYSDAAQKICQEKSDIVFFAGRDQDLPAFIEQLAAKGSCERTAKLRILKIGIGLEPTLTTEALTRRLEEAKAMIVNASSVDPAWWNGKRKPGKGLGPFLDLFEEVKKHGLGGKPLDDGYAVMYHDAFALLTNAVDRTVTELEQGDGSTSNALPVPTKDDVYNTLILPSIAGDSCSINNCLVGAAGSYGFEGPGRNDQWAVCKPVPVVEYPVDDKKSRPLYRTYRGSSTSACPA